MERKTSRCPAACSRPDLASWIAGFFSSVICRTLSRVTALLVCAKQTIGIAIRSFGATSSRAVPRKKNRRFIVSLVLRVDARRQRPPPHGGFCFSRFGFLIRNRALGRNSRRRGPDARERRYANKLR